MTRGATPYHPRRLVKVLCYAYAVGIPASRQSARALEEDMAFRVLTANQQPDFRTISAFRQQPLAALTDLFVQVVTFCQRAGLVTRGHVVLDGTKVQANAWTHTAMSYARMGREDARLQAEAADARDDAAYGPDRRGDELPVAVARREQRLETIRAATAVLEQEAQAEAAMQQAVLDTRTAARPRRGRSPQHLSSVPHPKAQRNFTDPESRIMPASGAKGSVVQGYHCQAAVDATAQIIVAADGTDEPNDTPQAQPLLTQVLVNTEQVPRTASVDAGYFSEANVRAIAALGCTPLLPPDRHLHGQAVLAATRGRTPAGLSVAARMRYPLRTKPDRRLSARRKAIMEPVFGPIKQGRGFRQVLLRGLRQVRGEWALICTTHHVLKLWTALRRRRRRPGERLRVPCGSRKAAQKAQR